MNPENVPVVPRCDCATSEPSPPISRGAAEPRSRGAVEPWSRGAVEPWSRGAVEPWRSFVGEALPLRAVK